MDKLARKGKLRYCYSTQILETVKAIEGYN